jgi:WD40 repeat protein
MSQIPKHDVLNPFLGEEYEPVGTHLSSNKG